MSALDLSPAPRAAPALRRVLAHARTELRILLGNPEQLLLAVVIPLGLLLGGHYLGAALGVTLEALAPSVLALAVWSTSFTSLAIMTGFERRDGVLERLVATPLGRTGLIVGKAVSVTVVALGQCLVLALVAAALGWRPRPSPGDLVVGVLATVLAGLAFAALGLSIAGRLKAEVTLGLANLIYLVGLVAGIMIPFAVYPDGVATVLWTLPTGAFAETLRLAALGDAPAWPLLVLLVWAAVACLVARKAFRWMS